MKTTVSHEFNFGQLVYLKTDPEQFQRMVIGIRVYADKSIVYDLAFGTNSSCHHEVEISEEKDVILATSN